METRDETTTGATVKALCVASNDRAAASKIHATTAHAGDYLIVPPKMESPCPVSGPPSKRPDLKRSCLLKSGRRWVAPGVISSA